MEHQELEKNEKNKESYENENEEKPKEKEIKIEKPKQENQITQNPFQTKTFHIINEENNNNNINSEGGKVRRKRRSKSEIKGRDFKCPNCGKSYLSAPALFNHRKSKHNYVQEGERKGRGRPRKDPLLSNSINQNKKKYETFFDNDLRKIKVNNDNEVINLDTLKQNLSNVFRQCKDSIFPNIDNVENYSFYIFLNENWNKEKIDNYEEHGNSLKNTNNNIIKSPPLDEVFFYYIKNVISKTNKDYFWFITKFIITFREYLNKSQNNLINKDFITEDKKYYSQIYNAEKIPDMCNDYFIEFMQPNNYFGLDSNELIELIQHFCYWLVCNNYTQSNLTLI
jgi:hypothetical protein